MIINYMDDYGTSLSETAAIFGITSPGMISKWRTLFNEGGYDALLPKKKGRLPMARNKHKKTRAEKCGPDHL